MPIFLAPSYVWSATQICNILMAYLVSKFSYKNVLNVYTFFCCRRNQLNEVLNLQTLATMSTMFDKQIFCLLRHSACEGWNARNLVKLTLKKERKMNKQNESNFNVVEAHLVSRNFFMNEIPESEILVVSNYFKFK